MKKIIPIAIAFMLITSFCQSDSVFNKIVRSINKKATSLQLSTLVNENKNKPISGKGYVIDVAKNAPEGILLTLSTTRSIYSSYFVSIKLFVSDEYTEQALKMRKGSFVRFSGNLKSVTLNEILVNEGSIKKQIFLFW